MGVFFAKILADRGYSLSDREKFIPLWKLTISKEEELDLVRYIRDRLDSCLDKCAIEIILLYSIWWRTRYHGGSHSWDTPLLEMNVCSTSEDVDIYKAKIVKVVREALEDNIFNITLYKSGCGRRQFLESSLIQGGFPINALNELQSGNSGFQSYLQSLYDRYKYFPINDPKWSDTSLAEVLAENCLTNRSFKNESFYDVCLEIVKAACFPEDYSFDVGHDAEIRNILNRIKTSPRRRENVFSIEWKFVRKGEIVELLYDVRCPKEVYANEGEIILDSSVESYYIDNQCVATYQNRHRVSYLSSPQKRDISQGSIRMWRDYMYRSDTSSSVVPRFEPYIGLRNGTMPVLDHPIVLQYDGMYWVTKTPNAQGQMVCMFPSFWACEQLPNPENVLLSDKQYRWAFFDWDELRTDILVFNNLSSREDYSIHRNQSNYEVIINDYCPDWVDSTIGSQPIVINTPARSLLSIYYLDEAVSPFDKRIKIEYKTLAQTTYCNLRPDTQLPSGHICLRINLPDNTQQTISLFNINDLSYNKESDTKISFTWLDGVVRLDESNEPGQYEGDDNTIILSSQNNIVRRSPIIVKCVSRNDGYYARLRVTSPSTRPGIFDSSGTGHNQLTISNNDLYRYRFYIESRHVLSLSCVCNGTRPVSSSMRGMSGEFPLDFVRQYVEKYGILFNLNAPDAYLEMLIKETTGYVFATARIMLHSFHVIKYNDGVKVLSDNQQPISCLNLGLVVPDAPDDSEYCRRVFPLKEQEPSSGVYMPDWVDVVEQDDDHKPFNWGNYIVFAKDIDVQILPTMIYVAESPDDEERKQKRDNNLVRWSELLNCLNDALLWRYIRFFFETVVDYHLPFQTFNCFTAMKDSPEALAELCCRACWYQWKSNDLLVEAFVRYGTEMGFSFHYIPYSTVFECSSRFMSRMRSKCEEGYELVTSRDEAFRLYFELLSRHFGDTYSYSIAMKSVVDINPELPVLPDFSDLLSYFARCNQTYSDSTVLHMPQHFNSNVFERYLLLSPRISINGNTRNRLLIMKYFCIAAPQLAAQAYINAEELNLWENDPNGVKPFIRRMINFISNYAPDVYKELFIITLGKLLS